LRGRWKAQNVGGSKIRLDYIDDVGAMEGALAVSFQRVGAAIAEARPMRQRNDVQLRQIVCEPGNMGDNEYIPRLNPDFLTRNKVLAYNFSRCLARKIPRAMIGRRHATYRKGDLRHVGALP